MEPIIITKSEYIEILKNLTVDRVSEWINIMGLDNRKVKSFDIVPVYYTDSFVWLCGQFDDKEQDYFYFCLNIETGYLHDVEYTDKNRTETIERYHKYILWCNQNNIPFSITYIS